MAWTDNNFEVFVLALEVGCSFFLDVECSQKLGQVWQVSHSLKKYSTVLRKNVCGAEKEACAERVMAPHLACVQWIPNIVSLCVLRTFFTDFHHKRLFFCFFFAYFFRNIFGFRFFFGFAFFGSLSCLNAYWGTSFKLLRRHCMCCAHHKKR